MLKKKERISEKEKKGEYALSGFRMIRFGYLVPSFTVSFSSYLYLATWPGKCTQHQNFEKEKKKKKVTRKKLLL
jgi:hypothetical protein